MKNFIHCFFTGDWAIFYSCRYVSISRLYPIESKWSSSNADSWFKIYQIPGIEDPGDCESLLSFFFLIYFRSFKGYNMGLILFHNLSYHLNIILYHLNNIWSIWKFFQFLWEILWFIFGKISWTVKNITKSYLICQFSKI